MKRLRRIPCNDQGDLLYGYYDPNTGEIFINIQHIWKESRGDIDKFIKDFTGTWDHEVLHLLIDEELGRKHRTTYGEEKFVRKVMKERLSRRNRYYYIHDKS